MYVSCDICEMKLQNDADLRSHQIGVHSHIECQSCGKIFSTPAKHKKHLSESHAEYSFNSDLEDLGIVKLPVYSRRIKQTFTGLLIDEAGSIEVEDSDDDYQETTDDELYEKNRRKRKVTESLIPNKRSKPNKTTKSSKTSAAKKTSFICEICNASLSRQDSLSRHLKKNFTNE